MHEGASIIRAMMNVESGKNVFGNIPLEMKKITLHTHGLNSFQSSQTRLGENGKTMDVFYISSDGQE